MYRVQHGQRIKMRRAAQLATTYPLPAWKRLASRPRNGRRRGQFLFTRAEPVEFKRAVPLIFRGEKKDGRDLLVRGGVSTVVETAAVVMGRYGARVREWNEK